MASVTQQIPTYKLGISELPDELKVPGQVVDLNNGIPDITRGLMKRPGSDLVKAITPAASGKWFPIYRDQTETYIGQVATDGSVKIFRCSDGVEIPVDYINVLTTSNANSAATYLVHTNPEDIQAVTVNETTLFANRTKNTAMLTDSTNKTDAVVNEAFVDLRTITYGKQYALDIFDPDDNTTVTYNKATALEADEDVDTSGINSYSNDGKCEGMNRSTVVVPTVSDNSGTTSGAVAVGSTSPPSASNNGRSNLRYEMDTRCTPVPQPGSVSSAYDDSYQPQARLEFGGEGWSTNDTHDYTSVKGLETQVKVTAHVAITARANVALVRPAPTASNSQESVTAEGILSGIKTTIDAISGTGLTATICGQGIHLHRTSQFNVTTPEQQLMEIITGSANDPSELPKACRHGYVVRVVNSGEDQDDYYLQFKVEDIPEDTTVAATYARSGTTITITSNSHGLVNGDTLIADFTSGGATDGWYTVANKTTNTFEVTDSASGTISAGATLNYNPNRFGPGIWEECAAPNLEVKFDKDTMPLKLTRVLKLDKIHTVATSSVGTSNNDIAITGHGKATGTPVYYNNGGGTTLAGLTNNTAYYCIKIDDDTFKLATNLANANAGTAIDLTGTGNNAQTFREYEDINGTATDISTTGAFRFGYPGWDDRGVGDDATNPKPSFVGYPINKIFFYRNRIGLISQENVILSRTNDFYNFWAKTAFTIANADPIDLQASSVYPTELFDAIEVNAGLLVFSASQQFLLSTDEAIMTPETAKISFQSAYAFNEKTEPFSMGITVGWLNSTAKRTRFHEMANVQRNGEPSVLEQSKLISKLFPDDITLATNSVENQMVLFASENKNEVWGYKYYIQGTNRIQSSWFRWELPGTVTYHCMMDDTYYAVLKNGSSYTLEAFDIKKAIDTLLVGDSPQEYLIHLDTKKTVASADLGYNSSTNKTTFTLGTGYYSSKQLEVYIIQDGPSRGRTSHVESITGSAPNETVTVVGNWKYYELDVATTAVNTTAETITLTGHSLSTGESVTYQEGSSAIAGLTDNTVYYVIKVDANTIKLATTANNATAGTAINLTSVGAGTHKLQVPTDIIVGYEYEFEVELPTIYIQSHEGEKVRSETRGSLVIHRLNFSFGSVGYIDTTIKRKGRPDYSKSYESTEWDSYAAGTSGIVDDYIHTLPVYDRNTNLSVHLKSTHPTPATLHSVTWEGDYSSKYYRRV